MKVLLLLLLCCDCPEPYQPLPPPTSAQALSLPSWGVLRRSFIYSLALDPMVADHFLAMRRAMTPPENHEVVLSIDIVRVRAIKTMAAIKGSAAAVFYQLNHGQVLYRLGVDWEALQELMGNKHPVSQAIAESVFLKEGATMRRMDAEPIFYMKLDRLIGPWAQGTGPMGTALPAVVSQIDAEYTGYRAVLDYLDGEAVTVPVLRLWLSLPHSPEVLAVGVRLLNLLENGRTELDIRRNILEVDIQKQFPFLYKATKKIMKQQGDEVLMPLRLVSA